MVWTFRDEQSMGLPYNNKESRPHQNRSARSGRYQVISLAGDPYKNRYSEPCFLHNSDCCMDSFGMKLLSVTFCSNHYCWWQNSTSWGDIERTQTTLFRGIFNSNLYSAIPVAHLLMQASCVSGIALKRTSRQWRQGWSLSVLVWIGCVRFLP